MDQLIALIMVIISMMMGDPAPTTVSVIPNNGDGVINIASTSGMDELSDYELEEGYDMGLFEVLCSDSSSPIGRHSLSSSGGGSPTTIDVNSCTDLTIGGAEFEMVEYGVDFEISCNDCIVSTFSAKDQNQTTFDHTYGIMMVTVTGQNPELVITGK